jgi:hypothetical protein
MIRTEKQRIDDFYGEMLKLVTKESWLLERDRLYNIPFKVFPEWYSGYRSTVNLAISWQGKKYFSIKATNPGQSIIQPDAPEAIEFYRCYTDADDKEWISGERVINGFRRWDNGVLYEAYSITTPDIFLNTARPSVTQVNWRIVTE